MKKLKQTKIVYKQDRRESEREVQIHVPEMHSFGTRITECQEGQTRSTQQQPMSPVQ